MLVVEKIDRLIVRALEKQIHLPKNFFKKPVCFSAVQIHLLPRHRTSSRHRPQHLRPTASRLQTGRTHRPKTGETTGVSSGAHAQQRSRAQVSSKPFSLE